MSISFWYDSWASQPLARIGKGQPRLQQPSASLSDAHTIVAHFKEHTNNLQQVRFTEMEDQISWNWTGSELYSAKSAYKVMMGGGKVQWPFMVV